MAAEPEPVPESNAEPEDGSLDSKTKSFEELCVKVKSCVPEAVGGETWYLIIVS